MLLVFRNGLFAKRFIKNCDAVIKDKRDLFTAEISSIRDLGCVLCTTLYLKTTNSLASVKHSNNHIRSV